MARSKKQDWRNQPTHERATADVQAKEQLRNRVSRWRDRLEEEEAQGASTYDPVAFTGFPLGTIVNMRSGHHYARMDETGETLDVNVKGSFKDGVRNTTTVVAVGDRVHIDPYQEGGGLIVAIVPRRTTLARPDPFRRHLRDMIVTNVDQLVIVTSIGGPAFWPELVDRYLVYAEYHELEPLLIVNKVDQGTAEELSVIRRLYAEQLGYRVLFTSAARGEAVDELREAITGRWNVVAGLSGVGKSSLLNAVQPGLNLSVGEVSEFHSGEGQHTTTTTTLLPLEGGGYVADTPGIRGFGLWDVEPAEIDFFFRDFRPLLGQCKFSDCTHHHEPKCAIRQAVDGGHLAATRYASFLTLYAETDPAADRHY